MVYTGCPSGSEVQVVQCRARGVWFCVGYATWVACVTFGIYGILNTLGGQYFSVISPLYISDFSGFSFKNKCGR